MNEIIPVDPKDVVLEGVLDDSNVSKFKDITHIVLEHLQEDEIIGFEVQFFYDRSACMLYCKIVLAFQNGASEIIESSISDYEIISNIKFVPRVLDKLKFKNPKNARTFRKIKEKVIRTSMQYPPYKRLY